MFVNNFDYNDYFSEKRCMLRNEHYAVVGTSALSIITPKQSITTLTLPWIDENGEMTSGLGGHSESAEKIINKIFSKNDTDYKEILNKCIYIIYSVRSQYSLCIIYLPDNISLEQYLLLEEFSNSIDNALKDKPWKLEIHTICTNEKGQENRVYDINNFNNTLVEAKKRIVENYQLPYEEKIIVKTEKDLVRARKNKNE